MLAHAKAGFIRHISYTVRGSCTKKTVKSQKLYAKTKRKHQTPFLSSSFPFVDTTNCFFLFLIQEEQQKNQLIVILLLIVALDVFALEEQGEG